MSRMTKYLHQLAVLEPIVLGLDGKPTLDLYGNPSYAAAQPIKCRRERILKDIFTTTGSIVKSTTTYTVDSSVTIHVGDLLDAVEVLEFQDYIGAAGRCEGYKVLT